MSSEEPPNNLLTLAPNTSDDGGASNATHEISMDDLPNEVLARILDHVPPLNYIVRMSHLSKRWRSVAHAHPTFCRHIQFMYMEGEGLPSPARGALFVKQITCSVQPIHLSIMILQNSPHVVTTLLPLLSEHMHRIVSLSLVLHFDYPPDLLFATLNRPAPQLRWLRLDLQSSTPAFAFIRRILPRMIFGGQSPLQTLLLHNVELPDGPVSGIELVERVALYSLNDMSQIARALHTCPRARRLDLVVNEGTDQQASDYLCTPAVAQLQHIYLRTAPHILHYYRQLLTDFVGPLRVTELFETHFGQQVPSTFDLTIVDHASGRERRFGDNAIQDLDDIAPILEQLGLADRIIELTMCINALDIAGDLFPKLNNLEVFTVLLEYHKVVETFYPPLSRDHTFAADDEWKNMTWLECPAVKKIVIAGDGQTCTTQWLANFMGYTIGATCRRHLELELRGVTLVGDPCEIWGYFKAIRMTPPTST
ncbi:hypothetical protein AURDEDRAFT_185579 [Auricularia subglabra TFB-10046 SS5]|nr:hypothetical protein AURDEDRAFT_185579 [Auricularia subglabra TFB-10046 SS5]